MPCLLGLVGALNAKDSVVQMSATGRWPGPPRPSIRMRLTNSGGFALTMALVRQTQKLPSRAQRASGSGAYAAASSRSRVSRPAGALAMVIAGAVVWVSSFVFLLVHLCLRPPVDGPAAAAAATTATTATPSPNELAYKA